MKKLMIVAAAAAMVATSEAAYQCSGGCSDGCGAVYKIAISLKTTAPKLKGAKCEECTAYRVQKSMKINGYIWGEGACNECSLELPDQMAIWSTTSFNRGPIDTDLHLVAGAIDKPTGTKIEAHGDLGGPGDGWGWLKLAGFGSMTASKQKNQCEECEYSVQAYVKNLNGYIAGWRVPDAAEDCDDGEYICTEPIQNTAAYGTWKIGYNDGLSKKLACSDLDLPELIKFPKAAYGEDGDILVTGVDTNVEE